ncbi:uncharacterized protein SOCE26_091410 [Sorangium cellulosum]|uniref:Uncharacterized protein n=1 Tax=Sorangium cellulosum TaxID=56 RepID=A0A2L0F866_SORCE|nr:uncharacterized protein SOCE26_091410 [Sorangium cellulosum]
MVERDQLSSGIGLGVYEAITQFQALASADEEEGARARAAAGG